MRAHAARKKFFMSWLSRGQVKPYSQQAIELR